MEAMTLPGDIEGLLRRGSPVIIHTPKGPVKAIMVRPCDHAEDGWEAVWEIGGLEDFGLRDMHLDLSDPTGRAHAAWWADARDVGEFTSKSERFALLDAQNGSDMGELHIAALRTLVLRLAGRAQ